MATEDDFVVVGKIVAPYGIKGWVKVLSYTDPHSNLLEYTPWYLSQNQVDRSGYRWRQVTVLQGRAHGKGLVAQFESVDDRDDALILAGCDIAVKREQLPPPQPGDYYWVDLIGLKVINLQGQLLGIVDHLLETGANDVLVVNGGGRERLIPYVKDEYIKRVDLHAGELRVDWELDWDSED